ncbi:hypothetical protein Bbelb_325110 [Branchiostoma belcheri]|nr:hypothetical protein Bbelb_325110 [Branchiostoma belcheri]
MAMSCRLSRARHAWHTKGRSASLRFNIDTALTLQSLFPFNSCQSTVNSRYISIKPDYSPSYFASGPSSLHSTLKAEMEQGWRNLPRLQNPQWAEGYVMSGENSKDQAIKPSICDTGVTSNLTVAGRGWALLCAKQSTERIFLESSNLNALRQYAVDLPQRVPQGVTEALVEWNRVPYKLLTSSCSDIPSEQTIETGEAVLPLLEIRTRCQLGWRDRVWTYREKTRCGE